MHHSNISRFAPTLDDIKACAETGQLECKDFELEAFQKLLQRNKKSLEQIDDLPEVTLPVKYPRGPTVWPSPEENAHKAWYVKCTIQGAAEGSLQGRTVAVKDNICVAEVPMMTGSRLLSGLVPQDDATVVTMLLDAGCTIIGKSTCESFCVDGVSYNTDHGAVVNPHNSAHSAGGSSSGSAVLVATNQVDLAIGADQGGSIRMPASCCGIVGMKPTFGLVSYTGALSTAPSRDHLGPMTRNVKDCALMLEAMAGYDPNDGRQHPASRYKQDYTKLDESSAAMKIGVLKQGFDSCNPVVERVCNHAIELLRKSNRFHSFQNISIPLHETGALVADHLLMEHTKLTILDGCGMPTGLAGYYSSSLQDSIFSRIRGNTNGLSSKLKMSLLWSEHVRRNYGPRFYAKSRSYMEKLRQSYDEAFQNVDVLLLPTMKVLPPQIPAQNCSLEDFLTPMIGVNANTTQFNGTGHPALSLNCGHSPAAGENPGLPVGLMLVGRRWEDDVVLRAAANCEAVLEHL